jgi:hypothetical protein
VFWRNKSQKYLIFAGELRSEFGDKILLKTAVPLCTAFKVGLTAEQWMQCSFNHVNISRVEKFIVDSCSVFGCHIVQRQNINIKSAETIIREYFPSAESVGCPTSLTKMSNEHKPCLWFVWCSRRKTFFS